MISVMFDSNVYQYVLSPEDCQIPPYTNAFMRNCEIVNAALKTKKIDGYLSEIIYQMEAIPKNERKDFFTKNMPSPINFEETENENGVIKISIRLGQNNNIFPMDHYRDKYLKKASDLGIRIIRNSRIGFPKTSVPENMFLNIENKQEFHTKNNKKGEISNAIKQKMAGIAQIIEISAPNARQGEPWFYGLDKSDRMKVSKAFAEWADGDAIATCGGYCIDYFCTEDSGKNAGISSIFSQENKKWLQEEFNIRIINIKELVELLN